MKNENAIHQVRDSSTGMWDDVAVEQYDRCNPNYRRIVYAAPVSAPPSLPEGVQKSELTVWYGPMPESNGKSNFTATLMRKGASMFDTDNYTFSVSEYPGRVQYDADAMRYLIGELAERPCPIDYDSESHSGYVHPAKGGEHPDELAVYRFAARMIEKMAASRAKGRGGWQDTKACPTERLQTMLLNHVLKGDPVDVANFCMMLSERGEPTRGWDLRYATSVDKEPGA